MTEQPSQSFTADRVRLRDALDALPAYKPGKPAPAVEGLTSYKISSNENPYPPLPSVQAAVARAAEEFNRYPDMGAAALLAGIAEHCGVESENVAVGTGSVGLLQQLVQITCEPGDEVVHAWRSFEAYPIVIGLAGARSVQVPLDAAARHDLPAMLEAITERTRLVVVCTPNNPTGPSVHTDELRDFLAQVPPEVLVVLDEAYLEFNRDEAAPDALAMVREFANTVVLRTFSKAYGLAGLRVGYAIGTPRVAEALRKAAVPFGVSQLAQDAVLASFEAGDELAERVEHLVAERTRVVEALLEQGWEIPETQANFVWLPLGDRAMEFAALAAEGGLVVRPFDGEGVRVTIGEDEANTRFLDLCARFRGQAT
ncbi:histidinol-phosphate aminotransferase [Kytococcus aerolatus]|uniref:Aromatic amino acid aminotransferase n=1 Tax=Kytococcus aerolatus TaxID=592308 RepID=A0A212TEQ5_9MICO|nr:histidinol-phosphate transaminase [Kytococcus aerolatus]SNC64311.1 histidinol-phosphate aminotransferase [Kytococcus aerolatus]